MLTETASQDGQGSTPHVLSSRQVTMISLGGIIGAGLFVGSGALIRTVGPAVVITYAAAGGIVFLVMRMLAELAISQPETVVFSEYPRRALGRWAAVLCGWLYAYFWIIVVAVETIAGTTTLQRWIALPPWSLSIILLGSTTLVNLCSVKLFGEFEFWFASIKVLSIVLFVFIGAWFLLHLSPGHPSGISQMASLGGVAPRGWGAVLTNIPAALFATCGAEIAAVAAANSKDPLRNITRSVQAVIFRVLAFYISAIVIIVMVVPWSHVIVGQSPFVTALDEMKVPYSGDVMNLVIFTALGSCLNSGIYVASRVIFGLAGREDAPRSFTKQDRRGTPYMAVIAVSVAGYAITLLSANSYKALFQILLNASGAIMLMVYLIIAAAQIANRIKMRRAGQPDPIIRIWLFPWLSVATMAIIIGALVSMAFSSEDTSQLFWSLAAAAVILAVYAVRVATATWRQPKKVNA